jgi:hypothetical protein
MAAVLVAARLCEPSSELHIAEDWYRHTALSDLLQLEDVCRHNARHPAAFEARHRPAAGSDRRSERTRALPRAHRCSGKIRPDVSASLTAGLVDETWLEIGEPDVIRAIDPR